jgi:NAD(P)-dependent dehydrogenase (short-subunit alcohol dehydrogenase family)
LNDQSIFKEKIVLVTGSGRGIGRVIALHLARLGADIAQVVAFLCSPAASMIRGQVILMDGDYTLVG